MRDRKVLIAVALVACAVALLVLLPRVGPSPDAEDDPAEHRERSAPELQMRSAQDAAKQPAKPRVGAPDHTEKTGRRTFVVRGRVTLPDGGPAASAVVSATGHMLSYRRVAEEPTTRVQDDGTYTLDLGRFFAGTDKVVGIAIEARHPRYRAVQKALLVSAMQRTGGGETFEADLQLEPAAVIIGQLLREDGSPVEGGAVRAFRVAGGRAHQPSGPQHFAETDAEGRFAIQHAEEGRVLLVGNAPALHPVASMLDIQVGRTTEVDPLVMRAGASITGVVRMRGKPIAGIVVRAKRNWKRATRLFVGRHAAGTLWDGEALLTQEKQTVSDAEGRFEVTGLSSGPYELRLGRHPTLGVHWDVVREILKPRATAPASDVALDLDGSLLTLRCVDEAKEPVLKLGMSFGGYGINSGDDGVVRILLAPNSRHEFWVGGRDGWARQKVKVVAGATGTDVEQTIVMQPLAPAPSLRVVLVGAHTDRVDVVGIGLYASDTARRPELRATLQRKDDGIVLERAQPGTWTVEVRPGGAWFNGAGHFLPVRAKVEIPELGVASVRVPLQLGGRLQVAARTKDGRLASAGCEIRDSEGRQVDAFFWGRSVSGASGSPSRLSATGPSLVQPALPAGRYTLHLRGRGLHPRTVTAEVVAGTTTAVSVSMERDE